MKSSDCILFSGGAPGAEAAFCACAERHGIEEVNFTLKLHVYDQQRRKWFWWNAGNWQTPNSPDGPVIMHRHFTGTGTRTLLEPAERAIEDLFTRSFK